MNAIVDDAEKFRSAVHAIAQAESQTAHGAVYAGAAAVAMRRAQLTFGGDFTNTLIDELASDRLATAAAEECGAIGARRLDAWLREMGPTLPAHVENVVVETPLSGDEQLVRRATIEFFLDTNPAERTAVVAFAAAIAVSRTRWESMGLVAGEPASLAVTVDVLNADMVARMAFKQLDQPARHAAATRVGDEWGQISDRAEVIATMAGIEAAA